MKRANLQELTSGVLDVLVVGGGIVGCGIARDAALRGLRVGLIEREDFGAGTTSRSTRLIHGGLRYLELLDFGAGAPGHARARDPDPDRPAPGPAAAVPGADVRLAGLEARPPARRDGALRPALVRQEPAPAQLPLPRGDAGRRAAAEPARPPGGGPLLRLPGRAAGAAGAGERRGRRRARRAGPDLHRRRPLHPRGRAGGRRRGARHRHRSAGQRPGQRGGQRDRPLAGPEPGRGGRRAYAAAAADHQGRPPGDAEDDLQRDPLDRRHGRARLLHRAVERLLAGRHDGHGLRRRSGQGARRPLGRLTTCCARRPRWSRRCGEAPVYYGMAGVRALVRKEGVKDERGLAQARHPRSRQDSAGRTG